MLSSTIRMIRHSPRVRESMLSGCDDWYMSRGLVRLGPSWPTVFVAPQRLSGLNAPLYPLEHQRDQVPWPWTRMTIADDFRPACRRFLNCLSSLPDGSRQAAPPGSKARQMDAGCCRYRHIRNTQTKWPSRRLTSGGDAGRAII